MSEQTTELGPMERAFAELTATQLAAIYGAATVTETITTGAELRLRTPVDMPVFGVSELVRMTAFKVRTTRSVDPRSRDDDDQPFNTVHGYGRKLAKNGQPDDRAPNSAWYALPAEAAAYLHGRAIAT